MKNHAASPAALKAEYDRLRKNLARIGYISHGSVLHRSVELSGRSGYQWTRKVDQKTITVSLSQPQFAAMRQAVANPSSAVRKTAVLISRGLRNLDPCFLHYIFDCILNDPALLGQMQTQSLQQFGHQPLGSCHGA